MRKIILNLFKGYRDMEPTETTLEHIVKLIRQDAETAVHTEKHRHYLQRQEPAAAAREKAACPCFAVSVHFDGGKRKEHIDGWTHLCLADLDHIAPERMADCLRRVREDPHTLLAYTTISGEGLRIIATYEAADDYTPRSEQELHVLVFRQMNEHYARLTGQACDEKC